ncbi:Tol-Pal system beta propeller repeat protein TolB [bacterium]|nr:Tol-Pal system beta propeller repeat protein TolB [bacterium]
MIRRLHVSLRPIAAMTFFCLMMALASAQDAQPTASASPTSGSGAVPRLEIYGSGAQRQLITIYVKPFMAKSAQKLSDPVLDRVINKDLLLSGIFQPPANIGFAQENDRADAARGTIQFAEWVRIGVYYLVTAEYTIEGNGIQADVRVYDTASQQYIYGNSYKQYPIDQVRRLGHDIANDIIQRITGSAGVNGTQILFVAQGDSMGRSKQVAIMDADGFNVRTLTAAGELAATPCWGLNGTEIYFTTYRDYNPDLAGMLLRNRYQWRLSGQSGLNISPAWSEAARRIALVMTRDGNSEIYTIDSRGNGRERLTVNRAIDSSPAWSPDGSQIAFTSDRSGSPQIYVMDLRTREERRLTYDGNYNDGAAWSPDGKYIAFHSRRDGEFQVCTIRPDGSGMRVLTEGEDPSWAPNSLLIAFSSKRNGNSQIYSMYGDGTAIHQLTNINGGAQSPSWGPGRAK